MSRTVDELLGKARNRVKAVGVELEGGWNKLPEGTTGVERDGSVKFDVMDVPQEIRQLLQSPLRSEAARGTKLFQEWKLANCPQYPGELPSPVLKISEMEGWVRKFYPSHINDTCGLHLHMSFNTNLTYQRLMTPQYEKDVLRLMKEWAKREEIPEDHAFWLRVDGWDCRVRGKKVKSDFCRVGNKYIDEQARIQRKNWDHHAKVNRYTAVNYSYATHGTVELRFLPMFKEVDQSISALNECLRITNAFILSQREAAKEESAEAIRLKEELSDDREEIQICV